MKRWRGTLFLAALLWPAAAFAAPVSVTSANARVIKSAIAAHRGHVVVVDFWATWCGPCVAEFPNFVKFENRYKAKGVVVMAVSDDERKDLTTKVQPFLAKQHVTYPAFIINATEPEDFIDAFDPSWDGELPRTLIYDKRGHLVKSLGDPQTLKSLAADVKPYL
jgi:thiol-disulfide isomerase/thioredoxin